MTLELFAKTHHLKTRLDSCSESIIAGKPRKAARQEDRSHIFEDSAIRLGVCLLFTSARKWNNVRQLLMAPGCAVSQNGDREGVLTFDPGNLPQAKAAIKAAGCKTRRVCSPAQLEVLARLKTKARQSRKNDSESQLSIQMGETTQGGRAMQQKPQESHCGGNGEC